MDPLRLAVAVIALAIAQQAGADPVARWRPMIAEAAQRFGIPEDWIVRVMRAESAGQTEQGGRPIRSPKGAMGLMQLMPATWEEMRRAYGLGANPDDPGDNILAGAAYLRLMYDRFGYPGLFGAYNAGPKRYAAYLAGEQRLPGETIAYLGTVAGAAKPSGITPEAEPRELLFALRREVGASEKPPAEPRGENGLFAVRKDVP